MRTNNKLYRLLYNVVIMDISDKIFAIAIVLLISFVFMSILQNTFSINSNFINVVGITLDFIVGALIGAYIQKGEQSTNRIIRKVKK
ncbi:MAG: hypothetical protein QXL94_08105 [Candidatus Parvarchaeum sp.]